MYKAIHNLFSFRPENATTNETYDDHFPNNTEEEYAEILDVDINDTKKKQDYEKLGKVEKPEYEKMIDVNMDSHTSVPYIDDANPHEYEGLTKADDDEHDYEGPTENKEDYLNMGGVKKAKGDYANTMDLL